MRLDVWKWMERKKIDPEGVRNEHDSAKNYNDKFFDRLINVYGNIFLHPNGNLFEITSNQSGKRVTRVLTREEIETINKESPSDNN